MASVTQEFVKETIDLRERAVRALRVKGIVVGAAVRVKGRDDVYRITKIHFGWNQWLDCGSITLRGVKSLKKTGLDGTHEHYIGLPEAVEVI